MGKGGGGSGGAVTNLAAVGRTLGDEAMGGGGGGGGDGLGEAPPLATADVPLRRPRQLSPLITTPDPAAGGGGGGAVGAVGEEGDAWCETALEITRETQWRSKAPSA